MPHTLWRQKVPIPYSMDTCLAQTNPFKTNHSIRSIRYGVKLHPQHMTYIHCAMREYLRRHCCTLYHYKPELAMEVERIKSSDPFEDVCHISGLILLHQSLRRDSLGCGGYARKVLHFSVGRKEYENWSALMA